MSYFHIDLINFLSMICQKHLASITANRGDPNQTALRVVWSGSALLAQVLLSINNQIYYMIDRALDKREYLMINFLISHQTLCCDPSSEPSLRDGSE